MIHKNISLSTSNKNKIKEYKSFNLDFSIIEGADIKEIDSDYQSVVIHKAIDSGSNILVEDTVLIIDGKEVVDIKWKINELILKKDPKIEWITSLAILDNGFVYVYIGKTKCSLVEDAEKLVVPKDAFAFDPYLTPNYKDSFYSLEKKNKKVFYSPRKQAVDLLLEGKPTLKIKASNIPKWCGKYQNT